MDWKVIIGDGWMFVGLSFYIIYRYIKSVMEYQEEK
tara:strand:+ start:183 stop:290 length:108 start_codon:yes stop_codon:yes gene_type:complete